MTKLNQKNNQDGVTLLVAVLILSGMAVISSAVAFFAVQEIRASRAVFLSEPAINAAQTAGERGIWAIKRDVTLGECPTGSSLSISTSVRAALCKMYSSTIIEVKANVPTSLFLYNPDDPEDVSMTSNPFTSVDAINLSGTNSVTLHVERIDGTVINTVSVPPNQTRSVTIPAVVPGQEGRVRVTLSSLGDASVEVDTNQGIPGFPTVNASGCVSQKGQSTASGCSSTGEQFQRRLNITVPE